MAIEGAEEEMNIISDVKLCQELLLERQRELHIARYLSGGVQPKSFPAPERWKAIITEAEERVCLALDQLWEAMEEERNMPLFWLSFCDRSLPAGEQFIGVCLVRANSLGHALEEAWLRKCNPGGEVLASRITKEGEGRLVSLPLNTLLSAEQIGPYASKRG